MVSSTLAPGSLHHPIWHEYPMTALPLIPPHPHAYLTAAGSPHSWPSVFPEILNLQASQAERSSRLARPWSEGQPWGILSISELVRYACQLARWHYLVVEYWHALSLTGSGSVKMTPTRSRGELGVDLTPPCSSSSRTPYLGTVALWPPAPARPLCSFGAHSSWAERKAGFV